MSHLKIHLLGSPRVIIDGQGVATMRSDKVRALMAYLVVEQHQPHRREKLAGLFWPDYPEASARSSLRRALSDLRKCIGDDLASPPYLDISRQTIQFNRASETWIDVTTFIRSVKTTRSQKHQVADEWEDAIALYNGDFMEGFSLPDCPEFENWLLLTREQLKRFALDTLNHLIEADEARGDYDSALMHARHQLELEPWSENTHRQVMRLLAFTGQRDAALIQFETCRQILYSELVIEPSTETLALYEQLLEGKLPIRSGAKTEIAIRKPLATGICPYRGLSAFREEHASRFFGRESFTQRLNNSVRDQKVNVIIGTSGSGKSSVVYAGLLPHMREEGDWLIVQLRPGAQPFQSMAAAMIPLLEPNLSEIDQLIESQKLARALDEGDISLRQIIDRILEKSPTTKSLLIFIDQFEELYTLCTETQSRTRFTNRLLEDITKNHEIRDTPYALLLAMRADFMGQALAHHHFADILQGAVMLLGPMTRDELRDAIEKPAELERAAFESGLVERILDDVGEEPGNLPLLEFALTQLWEQADDGWLTHKGYEHIERVNGALVRYAEQIYNNLSETEKEQAKYIFSQLVRPGEGTEDTRRLASRADIGESNWTLVQYLADKRLIVTGLDSSGSETVELIHEALIGVWGRYRDWIESDRSFRIWQERLRAATRQWEACDRDEDALLRGALLTEAEVWLAERVEDLSPAETQYIHASQEFHKRMQAERDRLRQRITLGLALGFVVTLILAILAGWQWLSAQQAQSIAEAERDQTRRSLSRSLASQAQLMVDEALDTALLLSVEAANINPSVEARSSLLTTLSAKPQLTSFLHGHQDDIMAVAFSSDGRYLATGSADGEIILWEFSNIENTLIPEKTASLQGHTEAITNLVFNPEGRLLASGSTDDTIRLWDVQAGVPATQPLIGHHDNIWSIAFSKNGQTLISSGKDGQILLWDLDRDMADQIQPGSRPLAGNLGTASSLTVSPDGNILAAGFGDGSIRFWDLDNLNAIGESLTGHDRLIRALAFSPDGEMLASGGDDRRIILWDTLKGSPTFGQILGAPIVGHDSWITGLAFHPDRQVLVSSGKDGRILSWDLLNFVATGRTPSSQVLADQGPPVWGLGISPDGRLLVSSGGEQNAILWDLTQIHPLAQALLPETLISYQPILESLTFKPYVLDLAFSPDGRLLAAAYFDGSIILWDRASGQPMIFISVHMPPTGTVESWYWAEIYPAYGLAFSPDGRVLASATESHVYLWDANPDSETFGQPFAPPLEGHSKTVNTVAFSPDGQILASGGDDRTIILWDMNPKSTAFGESIVQLELEPKTAIMDLYFDELGTKLVSVGISNIHVLDMTEMPPAENRSTVLPISSRIYDPAFRLISTNPSGSRMAVPEENVIVFWDIDPGSQSFSKKLPEYLDGSGGRIYSTDISPDGRMLASGDNAQQLQLWDLINLQPTGPALLGHKNDVINVRFSPDGTSVASGDTDGVVILWILDLETWVANACRRANRNLTPEEWERFFGDQPYRATCAIDF